jgi:hypothetical protein
MNSIHRRIARLEFRRPAPVAAHMIDPHDLDPAVLAMWLTVDINEMTLAQLDLLDENLRRLSV